MMELPDKVIQEYLEARKKDTPQDKERGIKMVQNLRSRRRRSLTKENTVPGSDTGTGGESS